MNQIRNTFILCSLLLSSVILYGQEAKLDNTFGSKGVISLRECGFSNDIFYDDDTQDIYVAYSRTDDDSFSRYHKYFTDGVYKIDANSGELNRKFAAFGHARHNKNSRNHTSYRYSNFYSSKEKIFCFNRYTDDKDILVFNKEDGKISTFNFPGTPNNKQNYFIYHDERHSRILLEQNDSLYWLNKQDSIEHLNLEGIIDSDSKYIYYSSIQKSSINWLLLTSTYNSKIDSVSQYFKLLSLNGNNVEVENSFTAPYYSSHFSTVDGKSALINYSKNLDSIYYQANLNLEGSWHKIRNENGSGIEKIRPSYFMSGVDSILTFIQIDYVYEESDKDNILREVTFQDYSILCFDLRTKIINKISLEKKVNPSKRRIQKVIQVGPNSYVALIETIKKKKRKYHLYKYVIE